MSSIDQDLQSKNYVIYQNLNIRTEDFERNIDYLRWEYATSHPAANLEFLIKYRNKLDLSVLKFNPYVRPTWLRNHSFPVQAAEWSSVLLLKGHRQFMKDICKIFDLIIVNENENKSGEYERFVTRYQFEFLENEFKTDNYETRLENIHAFCHISNVFNSYKQLSDVTMHAMARQSTESYTSKYLGVIAQMDLFAQEKIKDVFLSEIINGNLHLYRIRINQLIISSFNLWTNSELFESLITQFKDLRFIPIHYTHANKTMGDFLAYFNNSFNITFTPDYQVLIVDIDLLIQTIKNILIQDEV